jgi:hypothetical protein
MLPSFLKISIIRFRNRKARWNGLRKTTGPKAEALLHYDSVSKFDGGPVSRLDFPDPKAVPLR